MPAPPLRHASRPSGEIGEHVVEFLAGEPPLVPVDDLDGGADREPINLEFPEEPLASP
jgi:hypothetical protein